MHAAVLVSAVLLSAAAPPSPLPPPSPPLPPAPATQPRKAPTVVAVLDFAPAGDATPRMAARIAEAVWMKLQRYRGLVMVDRLSAREALAGRKLTIDKDTPPAVLAQLGRRVMEADVVVWGTVEREAPDERFTIHARALDLTAPQPVLYLERAFIAKGYREIPFAVQRLVDAVRRDEAALDPALDLRPDLGPVEPDPAVLARPNLVANGGFEEGDTTPAHWEPVDGLVSFWVEAPDRRGKCIMFDTDVNADQWRAWHRKFALGTGESPPRPLRGKGRKYDTVAAGYGARLYSEFIPVKPGLLYRLDFDYRSGSRGAKVFVKGYALVGGVRREVWRCYKACRTEARGRKWEHFTRTFHPTRRTPQVRWIRVELFAYWPPTRYWFDNVQVSVEE